MNCEGYLQTNRFGFCLIVISKPCSCMTYHIHFSTRYRRVCDSMQGWHFLHCTVFIFFLSWVFVFYFNFPRRANAFWCSVTTSTPYAVSGGDLHLRGVSDVYSFLADKNGASEMWSVCCSFQMMMKSVSNGRCREGILPEQRTQIDSCLQVLIYYLRDFTNLAKQDGQPKERCIYTNCTFNSQNASSYHNDELNQNEKYLLFKLANSID